jgi:hypothetical protein
MKRTTWIVLGIVALAISTAEAQSPEKIGRVRFPVSCVSVLQQPFERAVALLHSFWYLESAAAFVAPNRFKALCGVVRASDRAGDRDRAKTYYGKLLATAGSADTERPELSEAKAFE